MRLFCAIDLDRTCRLALARYQARLREAGFAGRWTNQENLHLTLAFLGEQPDARRAAAALAETAGEPFSLTFGGLGRFSQRGGDVLYLAISPSPALLDLQRGLTAALDRQGLKTEGRPYRQHITLARRAGAGPEPAAEPEFAAEMPVRGFWLMESRLRPEGAQYRRLIWRELG